MENAVSPYDKELIGYSKNLLESFFGSRGFKDLDTFKKP